MLLEGITGSGQGLRASQNGAEPGSKIAQPSQKGLVSWQSYESGGDSPEEKRRKYSIGEV